MLRFILSSAAVMALLVPAQGAAQYRVKDAQTQQVILAEEVSRQGHLVAQQRADFEEAAAYLRSAAEIRGVSEATVRDLMNAGHFNVYARRSLNAASAFHAAGELALSLGDRATAAVAFRNAAHAADRVGDASSARRLMARSQALAIESVIAMARVADR